MTDPTPWRVHRTPYDPGPLPTDAFTRLTAEQQAADRVESALRRVLEIAASLDLMTFEVHHWMPGDPPPGFPRYYRTPQLALPPAPAQRALPPAPVRWYWQ